MNSWRAFPDRSWTAVGGALSGFGKGEAAYGASYALNQGIRPFLNGRVSARIRMAGERPIGGAGVISRANELRSFAAFYVVNDDAVPGMYSVRLAAFKFGAIEAIVGLKDSISIPNREFHISLQAFSGEMHGQLVVESATYSLEYVLPEAPFPGYSGLLRLYDSPALAYDIHIEEIMRTPILPDDEQADDEQMYSYDVFLSHSSLDKEKVLKVLEAFRSAGISYWIDHEQITFGDGIVAKIEEGLKKSRFVVVCLSKNLANSGWCRAEYGPILYREFSGDTSRRVIPLSLDGSKDSDAVPLLLSDKMRADFTDRRSFSAFLDFLNSAR